MSKQTDNEFKNEHDALFKAFFGIKQTMLDYLHFFLPPELLVHINLADLQLDETSYRTSDMKAFDADRVYRASFKLKNKKNKPLAIAFLLEHKSYPFAYIFVQLLTYMCCIWNNDIQNKRKLTFILPIVVYQSKKTWKYRPFSALFKGLPEEFHNFIPSFDYHITKVSEIEKEILEKLKGTSILHALFLAYQKLSDKVFVEENFLDFFISFRDKPELEELFKMFFGYVARKSEISAEEIEQKFHNYDVETESLNSKIMSTYDSIIAKGKSLAKEEFMSTYDSIIAKGKSEGITQGITQGITIEKVNGIIKSLNQGKLSIQDIAEIFEVSIDYVLEIKKEYKL